MAQGKIDNAKKAKIHVTDQDNSENFGGKLSQGFCIIARRGKSPLRVSSFDLEKWDIDTPKPATMEQPVTIPDHPDHPPEDEKRNTCPQCGYEAEEDGNQFVCTSRFCQARFIETGTGAELAQGEFEVGQEFEAYWMEKKYEMNATVRILSRLEDKMTIELDGAGIVGVEVYSSGHAEAFRSPRDGKAWIHPWNKKELRIKCSPLQAQSLKVQTSNMGWPIRLHPNQIDHMNARPYSHVIGQLAEEVKRKLQNDSGHDEVVFT